MADASNTTILGPETRFKGELTLTGSARILGAFEGTIRSDAEVAIGAGANVSASVEATSILIEGTVQGNMIARERLQLGSRAVLNGDVIAGALAVAEGASFNGRCTVGPGAVKHSAEIATRPAPESKPAQADWLAETPAQRADWLAPGAGLAARLKRAAPEV